jgi:hypothetical protein
MLLTVPQTFEMVFSQYLQHPEHKSLATDNGPCKADSHGLLRRYPVTASAFQLIGKETERGWEQAEDISTLLPSLKCYERNTGTADESLRGRLQKMSLNTLQKETGLSRNTILRARRGQRVHPKSLQLLVRSRGFTETATITTVTILLSRPNSSDTQRIAKSKRSKRSYVRSKLKCPVFVAHDLSGC